MAEKKTLSCLTLVDGRGSLARWRDVWGYLIPFSYRERKPINLVCLFLALPGGFLYTIFLK